MRLHKLSSMILAGAVVAFAVVAQAAPITIATVPVGNPGNAGEWSGESYGGFGPNRICGAVGYTYNIGKYEVTAGQYTAFLNAVGGVDTYALYNTSMSSTQYGSGIARSVGSPYTYTVAADFANRPVNYVSWGDAARFCNWLHNGQPSGGQSLSTTEDGAYYLNGATTDAGLLAVSREADWKWAITREDEWYKAAYHKNDGVTGNYFDYPTGVDTPAPGRDMADASGNNANYYGDPYPLDSPYRTTLVGEFQNSDSTYGTFDQGGNVAEWNETVVASSWRGLRGGSLNNYSVFLAASVRYSNTPAVEDDLIGFRVANVPEPGSLILLVSGAIVALILWRRRK